MHDLEEVRNCLDVWDVLQGDTELVADVLIARNLWYAI